MFGKSVTLFKMFGFAVRVDLSWLVIVVLVVWSLSAGVFPVQYAGLAWPTYLAMGLVGALGLFVSIVFHELCHSLVARRYGLAMRGITLFIFGGVAEMADEPDSPEAEFWMAIAGPISSAALAGAFYAAAFAAGALAAHAGVVGVLKWLAVINLTLVAFNLVPGFPLDGGRVLRSILWHFKHSLRRATKIAAQVGSGFGMLLIGLGFASLLLGNPLGGMWWILIGMFLRSAARQGYEQVLVRQYLTGEPVGKFMNRDVVTVPADLSVEKLVEDYIYKYHYKMFPVVDGDKVAGCVTTRQVKQVPRELWDQRTVAQIVQPCPDVAIGAEQDALHALAQMNRNHLSRLLVMADGQLLGIVSLKDLLKFLSLKLELEPEAGGEGLTRGTPGHA